MTTIAALFVATGGCYFGLDGVEPYDVTRDARTYAGPWPVVAHPPCERWGRYWGGGPMLARTPLQKVKGDDGGCFASALGSVRRWGGVLEHPEASHAWSAFGLAAPPRTGGWIMADFSGGWTCCVEQGHYGHRSRKATWLYVHGTHPPLLKWGPSAAVTRMDAGFHSAAERRKFRRKDGAIERLSKTERTATPLPFRDLLLSIARAAGERRAA